MCPVSCNLPQVVYSSAPEQPEQATKQATHPSHREPRKTQPKPRATTELQLPAELLEPFPESSAAAAAGEAAGRNTRPGPVGTLIGFVVFQIRCVTAANQCRLAMSVQRHR